MQRAKPRSPGVFAVGGGGRDILHGSSRARSDLTGRLVSWSGRVRFVLVLFSVSMYHVLPPIFFFFLLVVARFCGRLFPPTTVRAFIFVAISAPALSVPRRVASNFDLA